MLEIAIMLEGQNGLNWDNFKRIATLVEDLGFAGLYRSDHFTNMGPPDKDSLELWTSLTWLASHTSRIEFGPLVTPFSFRDPVFTARIAKDVDDLSGGRLTLGIGAGWQEREHEKFGYGLLEMDDRFARYTEGIEVIKRLLQDDESVTLSGDYYTLNDATLLPRPQRPGGPPILIGGNGPRRTLPLAAKHATEWNAIYLTNETFKERSSRLDELLEAEGRKPEDVKRSMMTNCYFGKDEAAVDAKLKAHPRQPTREIIRERGNIVGTGAELVEQLGEMQDAGIQRVMLQWLDLDDIDGLEGFAQSVLPQFTD